MLATWLARISPLLLGVSCSPDTSSLPQHPAPYSRHLLGSLGLPIALQEAALDDRTDDGQALAGLQLGGKSEEPWVLHVKVLVQLQQHQQLRPAGARQTA